MNARALLVGGCFAVIMVSGVALAVIGERDMAQSLFISAISFVTGAGVSSARVTQRRPIRVEGESQ